MSMCVSVVLTCTPSLYLMSFKAPFHAYLCVTSETAAVLVVTQQGLFNLMQWRGELEGEDVTDPDVLKAVEAAVRRSTSVKRIKIEGISLKWTNLATAILKGAAQSKPLREVELVTSQNPSPPQKVVDDVRRANPKLRLIVERRGELASHDITWHHIPLVAPHVVCLMSQAVSECCEVVCWYKCVTVRSCEQYAALEEWLPLTDRGIPLSTHPVVPVCGSVDWPRTFLFTLEGRPGTCVLLVLSQHLRIHTGLSL